MIIDFTGFIGREEALRKIGRFNMYETMYYRPDVFFHSNKVFQLIKASIPIIKQVFPDQVDINKCLVMSLVHDDPEILTGDIQSGKKAKMSASQLQSIESEEEQAIDELANRRPESIGGYNYRELLLEVARKQTLESQIVKWFDHLDAFGETMHELFAGNRTFITPFIDPELGPTPMPHNYYLNRFNSRPFKYPLLEKALSDSMPFLSHFDIGDVEDIVAHGKPHTLESLRNKTGIVFYDRWKQVLLNNLNEKEIENLWLRK